MSLSNLTLPEQKADEQGTDAINLITFHCTCKWVFPYLNAERQVTLPSVLVEDLNPAKSLVIQPREGQVESP